MAASPPNVVPEGDGRQRLQPLGGARAVAHLSLAPAAHGGIADRKTTPSTPSSESCGLPPEARPRAPTLGLLKFRFP
ncbi:MAG: hypothetical protein E6G84_12805 [Alphaproteobacteria bacterium]|nr:MAG: hypothetical protein E6G88_16570 [Alphaproteobacteria bacterium]TMJ47739.1 MAG: hypothetical protein E6G84_12805 [Alphaproteobacteria bacterium]